MWTRPLATATDGPPSASFVMSSPVEALTTGGPAVNTQLRSVMTRKSDIGAISAACPAAAPHTAVTIGTLPEHIACSVRSTGWRPIPCVAVGRPPAPSSTITSGTRSCSASSASRLRLAWVPAALVPASTVKSSQPAITWRPSIRARAGDERVGRHVAADERADLAERARIEQVRHARPGVELARRPVLGQALLAAHRPRRLGGARAGW